MCAQGRCLKFTLSKVGNKPLTMSDNSVTCRLDQIKDKLSRNSNEQEILNTFKVFPHAHIRRLQTIL